MRTRERQFVADRGGEPAVSGSKSSATGGCSPAETGRPADTQLVPRAVAARVGMLRADFEEVTGSPFKHFFCPILYQDDPVELCRAHIVNRAFEGAPRAWTVQRKDVDNHFGSRFESGFTTLAEFEKAVAHLPSRRRSRQDLPGNDFLSATRGRGASSRDSE